MLRLTPLGPALAQLALVSCTTGPTTDPLLGQWGAPTMQIVAGRKTVELRLACGALARFPRPLRPDEDGTFQLVGRARHFYGSFHVAVVGQVRGSDLRVTLTETYDGGGRDVTEEQLTPGVVPDFPGVICLAGEGSGA